MSEVIEKQVISVFGSHAPLPGSQDYELGRMLGQELAQAGFAVATGGYSGTMSAVSQGASEAGGMVVGVSSAQVEATRGVKLNRWVEINVRYDTLEERLGHLVKNNDGMVVLPGGIGTLSELALAWSYLQVEEISRRPLVLLGNMWAETLSTFVREAYVAQEHVDLMHIATSVQDAVTFIQDFR